ncbi:MAG: inositol monophosphatase family protein [Bacillales bacterium]|jgi:myo-inositol-1(or 4)-monophosphatase|nr:inositol monophosphatase family protein [Bacillales bacterium]
MIRVIDTMKIEDVYNFSITTVRELRSYILNKIFSDYGITEKTDYFDLVTDVDKDIERMITQKIREKFPHHSIVGEEGTGIKNGKNLWLIDPIDGTLNFIHQKRNFVISLAYYEDGVGKVGCIYDVIHDELYTAIRGNGCFFNNKKVEPLKEKPLKESLIAMNHRLFLDLIERDKEMTKDLLSNIRGIRSYGCAALEIAYVATGRLDAYITPNLSPWDFAAGNILIEEVGGKVSTIEKMDIDINNKSSFIASNKSIYNSLLSYF